jgi:ATP-dependent Clp protease ATP-binding subunit ClpB
MQADRFTEKSREAVAAAQELARARRNPEIASAHLLLALLDQAEGMAIPVLQKVGADPAAVRAQAQEAVAKLPTLSDGAEPQMSSNLGRVIRGAEQEMAKLGDSYITVGHLLLALAEDGSGVSDLLPEKGELERAVKAVQGPAKVTSPTAEDNAQALEKFGRDLTAEAESSKLDPVIGRDEEIRRVIQVLSRRTKNNPVLIGDPGVGKTAIVEGLAQRIVKGD